MVGKTIGRAIDEGQLPVYIERFGNFAGRDLRHRRPRCARNWATSVSRSCPTGALGLYTYYERLAQGLRQLMAGSRKFALEHITRDDIAALTHEAAEISGIRYIMDVDKAQVEKILDLIPSRGHSRSLEPRSRSLLKNMLGKSGDIPHVDASL